MQQITEDIDLTRPTRARRCDGKAVVGGEHAAQGVRQCIGTGGAVSSGYEELASKCRAWWLAAVERNRQCWELARRSSGGRAHRQHEPQTVK